jgi:hypothetical protein
MLETCIWKAHYSHIRYIFGFKTCSLPSQVSFDYRFDILIGDEAFIVRYKHRGAGVERFENRLPAQAALSDL